MFTSELETREFSSSKMPERYRNIAEKYLAEAQTIFGNDLLFFSITSSCAMDLCIDGWSDIDVLIVTKNFDLEKNKLIHEAGSAHDIRIALMLLTQYEFEHNLLDDKTRVVIWQLRERQICPNFVNGSLSIPYVTLGSIQNDDKTMMPTYLHKLRRLFWEDTKNSKRPIIKMLYIVIKMRLRQRERIVYTYVGAFQQFAKLYGEPEFDILKEIMSKSKDPSPEFLAYAQNVVKMLCVGEDDT